MWREVFDEWIIDMNWNKIYLSATEKILIKLREREERRVLALVKKYKDGREYIELAKKERHIFTKNNSWWINYTIISNLPKDMDIVINRVEKKKYYRLTVWEMLENGNFLHFLQNWFEKQYFVPISAFNDLWNIVE